MLLVIEDGHWADAPTLAAPAAPRAAGGDARVLAARHVPRHRGRRAGERSRRRSPTFADPRTSSACGSAGCPATSVDGVRAARGRSRPRAPELSELAQAISDLTEGNAFLVSELWRALIETGAVEVVDGAITLTRPLDGARHARRASARWSASASPAWRPRRPTCSSCAATVGAEFELDIVRRAAGLADAAAPGGASTRACGSGMIEELPSRRLAYRFTHELVREALYDRLGSARRAELHLRVGEALEKRGERSGRVLADLAHHFAAAAPFGATERARRVQPRLRPALPLARSRSTRRRRGLRTALELGIEPASARAEAYLELGTASHRGGQGARRARCVPLGRGDRPRAGSAELLARAAIGYEETCWRPGIVDQGAVELLEEAATRSATRARVARRACSAASPARSTSRAITSAARRRGTSAIAMARAARRSRRPGHRADALLLVARNELAGGDPRDGDRGEGPRRAMLGNTEIRAEAMALARAGPRRRSATSIRRDTQVDELLRDGRADRAAVHAPRRGALRLGDRALRRPPRGRRGHGRALARVEPRC